MYPEANLADIERIIVTLLLRVDVGVIRVFSSLLS